MCLQGAKVEPIIAGVACSRGALQCLQCVPDRQIQFMTSAVFIPTCDLAIVHLSLRILDYMLQCIPEGCLPEFVINMMPSGELTAEQRCSFVLTHDFVHCGQLALFAVLAVLATR